MPTSVDIKNLKINKLTEAQYDTAVQGGVIGENELSVLTDLSDTIQVATMPTASASNEGQIVQYVGATDSTYTNAYFYKCVSDGQSPATYSWEAVEVQAGSGGGLPDQTGNAGKFLTTDGTDASWGAALKNDATGTGSLAILSTGNAFGLSTNNALSVGNNSIVFSQYGIILGGNSSVSTNSQRGIVIGHSTTVGAPGAIQLGCGIFPQFVSNNDAETFKVANINGNFELMSADGTIPKERLVNAVSKPSTMPELTVAGWSNNTQTVTVTGVTATNTVFVSPAPASASDYASAGIICTAQGTDSLTFTCTTVPTNAITVNVVIMG